MGLRVNNNVAAMNSYRNLTATESQMSKSLEKLSSGFRINRAADDAAGLAISEQLRSQVGGLKVAQRNAQDGISVIQTTEGALTEVHSLLQRVRDLAVQSANTGANDSTSREQAAKEVDSALAEIDRIASSTKFGGKTLLAGDGTSANGPSKFSFQVGSEGSEVDRIDVAVKAMNVRGLGVNTTTATLTGAQIAGSDFNEQQSANIQLTAPDGSVTAKTVTLAANEVKRLDGTTNIDLNASDATVRESDRKLYEAALQKKVDAQFGKDVIKVELAATGSLTAAPDAAGDNTGAERGYQVKFSTVNVPVGTSVAYADPGAGTAATSANAFGAPATYATATNGNGTVIAANTDGLRKMIAEGSANALYRIDNAIKSVSEQRGELGAYQNRLEHTIANLAVTTENLSASESRIRDTDMAQEMTNYTRSQILVQAGTAMLAQANSSSQGVLSLLRG